MELSKLFKSVLQQDTSAVVICDLSHTIVYMNPVATERYAKYGGAQLVGKSIFDCHNERSVKLINNVVDWFAKSQSNNIVYTFHNEKENKDVYIVALRDDDGSLIGYYEKHEYRNAETSKLYTID
jgi:DUF438 domain-containing protein